MTVAGWRGRPRMITGAGSGIGRATARLFAAEGARLLIADRNADGLDGDGRRWWRRPGRRR